MTEHTDQDHAIGEGMVITLHLAMRDAEGSLRTETEPGAPLVFLYGSDGVISGLQSRLQGERRGARRSYTIPPGEAYGEADPRLLKATPRSSLPVAEPKVGMRLATRDEEGELTPMTIVAVKDEFVLLDLNPRFAGKTLEVDVEVLDVRPATDAELGA